MLRNSRTNEDYDTGTKNRLASSNPTLSVTYMYIKDVKPLEVFTV